MSQTKVKLNHAGFRELLSSPELAAGIGGIAAGIAAAAGDGYAHDVHQAPSRVIASAYAATSDAMRNEIENNSLLKAMQS